MTTLQDRALLLQLARNAITLYPEEPAVETISPALQEQQGAFVSLQIKGELRGCIGRVTSLDPLFKTVARCAVDAAYSDPRFLPVSREELPLLSIEISVLGLPEPLEYENPEELLARLDPERGVMIRKGGRLATFLPQVWEQLPEKEEFLAQLCMKAGLSAEAWKEDIDVLTYPVEKFCE